MLDRTKERFRLRIIIPAFPAFNIYSYIADRTTALGPVCVATAANKLQHWDVEVIDENNLRMHGPRGPIGADHKLLQWIRPADVVGFYGGLTSTIPRLYELSNFYKKAGCITLAGGQHFLEENIEEGLNSNLDYIIRGEAEETIEEFLLALENNKSLEGIKGLAYRQNGKTVLTPERPEITDFDQFPIPDFSLVRYARIIMYPVGRIRGCGMNCEFCTVKGNIRCASPERLMEQISLLLETKDARHFFVVDDLFGQQRSETLRFCELLKNYQLAIKKRLDLAVQIRLDKAKDAELLTAMRAAGINIVCIGYESPVEEELEVMNKHLKSQDMVDLTKLYHKAGFIIHGMFIFGYPAKEGTSFTLSIDERVKAYRNFIKKAGVDTIQVLLPVPLPGTEFRKRLQSQNRIYPKERLGWEYYDGNFPLFEPDPPITAEQMQEAVKKIMGKFYRFRHMFMILVNIILFPSMIFYLHNIKPGWRQWYRQWRNHLIRFGGWMTFRGWMAAFKKDPFSENLQKAKEDLTAQKGLKK
ncbi:MAG: B12-binding domain-containing radical SAM protein [Candidatus Omnitrophica bacterium]|nr:B12-binding domain-containing radical SAM protein [Candidatus Omnitrophota bacterium]